MLQRQRGGMEVIQPGTKASCKSSPSVGGVKGPIQPDSHCAVKGNAVVRVPIPEAKGYAALGHTEDAAGDEKGTYQQVPGEGSSGKGGDSLGSQPGYAAGSAPFAVHAQHVQ